MGVDELKVYKALIKTKEGGLVSLWAKDSLLRGGLELSYKEGDITYAPEGSLGIFVDVILEEAKSNGLGNWRGKRNQGYLVIHEATPLGNIFAKHGEHFEEYDRYPAILLGKEVWSFGKEPEKPKEEWVSITEECRLDWIGAACGGKGNGYYLNVCYNGGVIACLGLGGLQLIREGYKVEEIDHNYFSSTETFAPMSTFRILKRK